MFRPRSSHKSRRVSRPCWSSLVLEVLEDRCLLSSAAAVYGQLPLAFEPNVGQASASINYVARGPGYDISLQRGQADLWLQPSASASGQLVAMSLVGAVAAAAPQAQDQLPGVVNYLVGNDPSGWHTNVPTYGQITYNGVYSGIDLVYHGAGEQFEYDFVVHPGASSGTIRAQLSGVTSMSLDGQGDLVLQTSGGAVIEKAPVAYQVINGVQQDVAARYVILNADQFGFAVGAYDASQSLVIDPTIDYSTYLGGSVADAANAVGADAAGNAYITGNTASSDFPTANPVQGTLRGAQNAFIAKLNPLGTALLYATYVGGSGSDSGAAIAVDAAGDVSVTGTTSSSDFPTVNALQSTLQGGNDGFVARLNPAGNRLLFSSYLGGGNASDETFPSGIAADNSGDVYVTGRTSATNFPTTIAAFQTNFGDKVFYASSNGGSTWSAPSLNAPNFPLQAIAINPQTPSTIYAGGNGGFFNGRDKGFLKSTDGGVHWTPLTGGLPAGFGPIQIVIDPHAPTTLYAASTSQILKSTDAGADWTLMMSGLPANTTITALAINPSNPAILYTVVNGSVFESTNGAGSWSVSGAGLPGGAISVESLAVAPSQPSTLYATLNSTQQDLAKSTDGGAHWTLLSSISGDFTTDVTVDPQQTNTLYVFTEGARAATALLKSTDGGATFTSADSGIAGLDIGPLFMDPVNPSILYFVSTPPIGFGGDIQHLQVLFRTMNGGASWSPVPGFANVLVTSVAFDPTNDAHVYLGLQGSEDVFVSKLNLANPAAPSLAYSTFLGGSGDDSAAGLALDSAGKVFLTGSTGSTNFPTTAGAAQTTASAGAQNAFVSELNAAGSALVYSTYLGGSDVSNAAAIAVDGSDHAVVTGSTFATDFPTLNALQPRNLSAQQVGATMGFVGKFNASGQLMYSTYLGGSASTTPAAIGVDAFGDTYVAGSTQSTDFPLAASLQGQLRGSQNAFITKINATGSAFLFSTYLGGTNFEVANGLAVDAGGDAYVVGETTSTDFPVANPIQGGNHTSGGATAFITKFIPWVGADVTVGSDDNDRILLQGSGGTADIGIISGKNFTPGPLFAPYGGWLAKALATGSDGNERVLWSNPDGHTSVWDVTPGGSLQAVSVFAPITGWTAQGIAVGSDGVTRVFWTNANGAAAIWQLTASLQVASATVYGPITGWSADTMAAGSSDGLLRLLWTRTNGAEALWLLNPNGSFHSATVVGPVSGWAVQDIVVAPDNQTRLLWRSTQGQITVWAVNDSFSVSAGPILGPVAGWTAERIAAGDDGIVRVLWTNTDGSLAVWDVNADGSFKDANVSGSP